MVLAYVQLYTFCPFEGGSTQSTYVCHFRCLFAVFILLFFWVIPFCYIGVDYNCVFWTDFNLTWWILCSLSHCMLLFWGVTKLLFSWTCYYETRFGTCRCCRLCGWRFSDIEPCWSGCTVELCTAVRFSYLGISLSLFRCLLIFFLLDWFSLRWNLDLGPVSFSALLAFFMWSRFLCAF